MTLNQQITTLLESKGWKYESAGKDSFGVNYFAFWRRGHEIMILSAASNLANSLDACKVVFEHDAKDGYWKKLYEVVSESNGVDNMKQLTVCIQTCKATPSQRIEAYLRFKGLWKD